MSIINSELYRAKKFVRLFVKHTNETLSRGTMMKSSRERKRREAAIFRPELYNRLIDRLVKRRVGYAGD